MSSNYLCKGDFFRCQRKPFRILLKPTSIDCELVVRAKVDEITNVGALRELLLILFFQESIGSGFECRAPHSSAQIYGVTFKLVWCRVQSGSGFAVG